MGKGSGVAGKEGEGEGHGEDDRRSFGAMHLGFVFGSLEEVYEFVKNKAGGDEGSIR